MIMNCKLLLLFLLVLFSQNISNSRADRVEKKQRAALVKLRSSLGLRTKYWPLKSDPCSNWIGIECENGSVTGINISGFKRTQNANRYTTFSDDSLGELTKLVSFNASGFALRGLMPNWFGVRLESLRVLDLRWCDISGGIPVSVGNLSVLSELYLSDNSFTGTIPSSLGLLSRLLVLDLSRNALTGFIPFCLGSLSNVSLLDVSSNYLSGVIPNDFGKLLNLRYLNLSSNSLSSSIPTQLGNLDSLVVLDLSSNLFSGPAPIEFGLLRNLQRMVINDNSFTGELPVALWLLPGLRFLDVSDNRFIGSLPNISCNASATMAEFNLSHNMFDGELTSILKRVSFVDLSYNYFQGKIPDYARNVAFLDTNCFRNWSSQRNLKECAGFYSKKGLPFDSFEIPVGTLPFTLHDHKSNRRVLVLPAILGSLGLFLVLVISVILLIICSCKKSQKETEEGLVPTERENLNFSSLGEKFEYEKIVAASCDFNDTNLVKKGHSCDVFKGVLEGGNHIIIKRFDGHSENNICMAELDFFSKISHPRLVPLLGHCLESEKEKFLIYKYMPKGDLSNSFYTKNGWNVDSLKSLDWITRLKIAVGAAEGLCYLHHECFPPLVHRDIKASSILLDDKYEVRLGSLSKVCAQEVDTHSNRITRLLRLPKTSEQGASATATCAYDVYCFGKVLLELVTGILGVSASSGSTTKDLLDGILPYISIHDKDLVTNILDPSLVVDEDLLEEIWAMAVIARSCLNPKPSRRPLMRFILKALRNPLKVVREETTSSAKLGANSSRDSWIGGSWRHSLPHHVVPVTGSHLQGGLDCCLTTRRHLKDGARVPLDLQDDERLNKD